jgi:hypothetical protein
MIICHQDVLKKESGELDEAMFHGVESPYELILWNLRIERSRLSDILCMRMALGNHNRRTERFKMRLC